MIEEQHSMCVPDEIDWHFERKYSIVDSYDELCVDEYNIPDSLIDYDSYETMLSDMMVEEFINSLNDNEKYILSGLLNGMTHQEISDTMDCTRQNVTRTVERLGTKAVDFLSYN